jgi:hypothetical protein
MMNHQPEVSAINVFAIVIYDCNDSGLCYKTIVIYDPNLRNYNCNYKLQR